MAYIYSVFFFTEKTIPPQVARYNSNKLMSIYKSFNKQRVSCYTQQCSSSCHSTKGHRRYVIMNHESMALTNQGGTTHRSKSIILCSFVYEVKGNHVTNTQPLFWNLTGPIVFCNHYLRDHLCNHCNELLTILTLPN